jgi:hypothetical protein
MIPINSRGLHEDDGDGDDMQACTPLEVVVSCPRFGTCAVPASVFTVIGEHSEATGVGLRLAPLGHSSMMLHCDNAHLARVLGPAVVCVVESALTACTPVVVFLTAPLRRYNTNTSALKGKSPRAGSHSQRTLLSSKANCVVGRVYYLLPTISCLEYITPMDGVYSFFVLERTGHGIAGCCWVGMLLLRAALLRGV